MSLDTARQALKNELTQYVDWLVQNSFRVENIPSTPTNQPVESDIVMFSYIIDSLFEDVKMATAIRAKSIKDQNNKPLLDEYTITDDERPWFDKELIAGSKRVFDVISPMSKKIPIPYIYDMGVTITDYTSSGTTGNYYRYNGNIYKALQDTSGVTPAGVTDANWELQSPFIDTKGKVVYFVNTNSNIPGMAFTLMDGGILSALRLYILKQWYKITGYIQEVALKEEEYSKVVVSLKSDSCIRTKLRIPASDLSI